MVTGYRENLSKYRGFHVLAEREGFEPSVRLPVQRFSRPSRSTTLAPLRFKRQFFVHLEVEKLLLGGKDKPEIGKMIPVRPLPAMFF